MKRTVIGSAVLLVVFAAGFWVGSYQREPVVDQAAMVQQATPYSYKYPFYPVAARHRLSFSYRCSQGESKQQCAESIHREGRRLQQALTHWVLIQ
jgi:hypothetical protein